MSPTGHELRHYMKGYELYSWQQPPGLWHYALLIGTNRLKSPSEVTSYAITEAELRSRLQQLPALEDVFWECSWRSPDPLSTWPVLESPPKTVVDPLLTLARGLNIHLSRCAPQHANS